MMSGAVMIVSAIAFRAWMQEGGKQGKKWGQREWVWTAARSTPHPKAGLALVVQSQQASHVAGSSSINARVA